MHVLDKAGTSWVFVYVCRSIIFDSVVYKRDFLGISIRHFQQCIILLLILKYVM